MSQQNSNASSYSPLFTQKKPFNCLPIRKRPPIQTTIRTPKKQYVKLLELEKQRLQQCEDNQPLEETPEYPPTPGSHSSSSSHETASHPSSSLPYLMSSSLKKRPLKKAYLQNKATSLSVTKTNRVIRLPGNPLLWNNGSSDRYGPEMSTEDTINSFKLAWLEDSQESSQDETAVQEDTMVKKPASLKRGRPLQQKPTAEAKSTKKTSSNKPASSRHTSDEKLYCLCRQPYDVARFMIACDRCDDWFHGECIGIKETESEFIDLYYCDSCSKATGKETSWKPKCSNPNCFKAARISLSTGHLSKYCSDSCGLQVARARIELVEIKRRQNLQGQRISIEHLALQKHKQLHIHSLADRQNRQRLLEIRQEKLDIKDRLIQIGKRIDLLSLSQTTSECGFDPKLIDSNGDICRSTACSRHEDWSNILFLRLGREKKEEYDNLIRVEEERKRIKTLMQKRRSDKDIRERLTNMTYSF